MSEQCEWWCYGIHDGRLFLNCRKCKHHASATEFSREDRDRAQQRPFEQFRYPGAVDPIPQMPMHYSPGPMCGTADIIEKMKHCRIVDTSQERPADTPTDSG